MGTEAQEEIGGVANGWLPIETAPKDGTEVIGASVGFMFVYGPWTMAFNGRSWRPSWDGSSVVEYMSDFGTEYEVLDMQPTHWQPLPAPPITQTQDKEASE